MPRIITDNLRLSQIELITSDMVSNTSPHYVFLGRHVPYVDASGNTLDATPPDVDISVDGSTYDVYRNMICAKHITSHDIAPVVKYTEWQSGVVYDQYDHRDPDLHLKTWYVVVRRGTNYDLFICLGNNRGAASTVAPSYHDSTPGESGGYETIPDYYKWKYMFTANKTQFDRFATNGYIPVFPNSEVTGNSVHGSVDYVTVERGGASYDSYHTGSFLESVVAGDAQLFSIDVAASSNSNFYNGCALTITSGPGAGQLRTIVDYTVISSTIKRVRLDAPFEVTPTTSSIFEITPAVNVSGDGEGFVGRALVNAYSSNSVWRVEILDRGINYTWASASVVGNTGGGTNYANVIPMISPYGGHGFNPAKELHATAVGISVNFNSGESLGKVLDTNDFRVVGIVKRPQYSDVFVTVDTSNDFEIGDRVVQPYTGAYAYVKNVPTTTTLNLTNAVGYFVTGHVVTAQTAIAPQSNVSLVLGQSAYVDQTTKVDISTGSLVGSFVEDEIVTQGDVTSRVYSANSTQLRLTQVYGAISASDPSIPGSLTALVGATSQANAQVTIVTPGEFKTGSGEVLYIDNKIPVIKTTDQTETVKIILEF